MLRTKFAEFSCRHWQMSWNIDWGCKTSLWMQHRSSVSRDTKHYISWLKPMLSFCHSAQELYRISKENCDFKVTAGPSTSSDDKGSSGGDSGGNSPSSSSHGSAPPKKTSKYTNHQQGGEDENFVAPHFHTFIIVQNGAYATVWYCIWRI